MENDVTFIKPSEIESTLVRLYEKEKKANVVKASLFTLIIFTQEGNREEYLTDLSKSLIKKFPCRIIFIKESIQKGDFILTEVSALKPEGNDEGFFCEFIHFNVSTSYKERISSLITPHVIPDLPIYLLFAKDPSLGDTPTSLGLDKLPLRIIFDSECVSEMSLFATYIKSLHTENTDVGDLNWARFSPFRDLISKVYSNKEKLRTLITCTELTISYNSHETASFHHNKIQATYFQGWLATKLSWTFQGVACDKNTVIFSYQSSYGTHKVYIKDCDKKKSLRPGGIISVVIKNAKEETSLIRDDRSAHIIKICHSCESTCQIPLLYQVSKEGTGSSIVHEIYSQGTSKDFLAVIELLSTWKTGVIC